MKKVYQGVLGALFFLGFSIMPVLAEEVEPTEVETVEVTEQTETEPMVEPEEPEVEPISEPEPEVLNGWQENNTKYYIDGKAVNGVQNIDKDVYYFENETLNPYTGFVKNTDNKWIFVRDGKSDWTFTGVAKSKENGKWYHADKGVLNWNFTGISKSVENGKWYFSRKGALDWSFTGVAKSVENGKWYYVRKGALDWKYTGLGKSVENGKLYYCKNGSLDWKKNGYYKNKDGKRYNIKNGAAQFIRYVIAIDPGHGGSNSGTYTLGPHYEKTLNLIIANYLKAELSKHKDVYVVMTRTDDSFVGLEQRPQIAKRYDADYFISLHLNASVSHGAYGAEVYYQNTSYRSDLSNKSKVLAQSIQNELVGLGARDLGIKVRSGRENYPNGSVEDYYKVIRHSKLQGIPGILIEHCCADNGYDYNRFLNSDAKLKQLALADYRGIKRVLGL